MNISQIVELSRPYYENNQDPSHDWAHILRVAKTCESLGKQSSANLDYLISAAYMHDLINLPKNDPRRSEASTMTGAEARKILVQCESSEIDILSVLQIIKEHSYSKGLKPSSLEAAILQDADRLDAIGSIGILRCASVSTQMGGKFYNFQEPWGESRELDDKAFMLDHYQTKLYKLPELMNTQAGQKEAYRRVKFMKFFVDQFMSEIQN